MAFSYSDKNFTVIGNLCFVHIPLDGTEKLFDIPPAIDDRMLSSQIVFTYTYLSRKEAGGALKPTTAIGYAIITNSKISLSDVGVGYLYFYFPIDSNK